MSGFSKEQLKKLTGKLDRSRVQSRQSQGRKIDYIEGWFAIAEANAIFGFSGWDREMVHFERVFQQQRSSGTQCGYVARVRLKVRAGEMIIIREGTGFGQGASLDPAEAYERALKAAETDATKRALATFGNRFGLSLYDREQAGVTKIAPQPLASSSKTRSLSVTEERDKVFVLTAPDGALLAENLSAEGFCSGLRQLLDAASDGQELMQLYQHNLAAMARLRESAPELKSARGEHYADILERLIARRVSEAQNAKPAVVAAPAVDAQKQETSAEVATSEASEPAVQAGNISEQTLAGMSSPSRIAAGPPIDKSQLPLGQERRVRNKAHLALVGAKPCLICEQSPCHAHHITFAQRRGLSLKVSDEYTVPLCPLHHNELHAARGERAWWRKYQIEPLKAAQKLWEESVSAWP
jgi:DNA recombination protein Rad52